MVMDLQDEGCNSADCAWREGQCVPGNADAVDAVDADDNADAVDADDNADAVDAVDAADADDNADAVDADDNADAHVDDDADEREGQII